MSRPPGTTPAADPGGNVPASLDALDDATRLALARSIAKAGRALLIDADNKRAYVDGSSWWSLEKAISHVDHGRAATYAVEVAVDMLALDGDKPDAPQAAQRIVDECHRAGVGVVVLRSGGQDRRHVLARVGDPFMLRKLKETARELGFDVRPVIRPPGAPHRQEGAVGLELPATWGEALVILSVRRDPHGSRSGRPNSGPPGRDELGPEEIPATVEGLPRSLSPNMVQLLRTGVNPARGYQSRSEVTLALALGYVNAGHSFDAFLVDMLNPLNIGGAKITDIEKARGHEAAIQYVRRCFTLATIRARDNPAPERTATARELDWISARTEQAPWSGIPGATDYAVIRAHLSIARLAGRVMHHAASRDIAERAGVSRATVGRSRTRLVNAGWLCPIAPGSPGRAGQWRIQVPGGGDSVAPYSMTTREGGRPRPPSTPQAVFPDVWRWRGLGQLAGRLWEVLSHEELSVAALTRLLGRDGRNAKRSIRGCLKRLERYGLAEHGSGGWRRGTASPSEVAAHLRSSGAGERQVQRHAQERLLQQQARATWPARSSRREQASG